MVRKTGHVVHVVGQETPTTRRALCGAVKGKGWRGNPTHVSWLYDKWCSKCWHRFTQGQTLWEAR